MKKRIKVQGTVLFFGFALLALFSRFMFQAWRNELLDESMDFIGLGIFLLGFLFRASARGYKSEQSAGSARLVTGGPYGLTRNPMYFGTFLIGLGVILILCRWWVFPVFLMIFLSIYGPQTHKEEKKLSERFGEEYSAYCRKTPRFFPDPRRLLAADMRERLPLKKQWIKKEFPSFLANLLPVLLLEAWEDKRLFGRPEVLREIAGLFLIIGSYFILSTRRRAGSRRPWA